MAMLIMGESLTFRKRKIIYASDKRAAVLPRPS